ncbi:C4-dicarboxylate TRAP transporter substrate-binding protein [Tropicibacter sp. Alg240-R139]|uniref:C4-dicarboxylate TRAP transporter substrate-binding protein n=1 Tax=Tropicibacter sp. Alg240-R139 TaxID=2305991 RepID=UPI0013DEFE3E|nr:C4-dicarboxylate TRAP transporter substrate-binding protein [Tropicibacter sp. Alg240-R139]
MKKILNSALLMLALTLPASAEDMRSLRLGSASPPSHPAMTHLYIPFESYLPEESDGRLTGKLYGMDVVGLKEMRSALKGGLIDIGLLLPSYFPSDFPEITLTTNMSLLGRNASAVTAAITEYIVTCDECQREMADYGGVFLASGSTSAYNLLSREPIRSLEDLKGLKVRATSGPFARLTEALGAVPVTVSANDVFESMSQGTIDVSIGSISDLIGQRLMDVAKHVNTISFGTQPTSSTFTVGIDVWSSLSIEDRKAIVRAATRANMDFTQRWDEMSMTAQKEAEEIGIEFVEPDSEFASFVADFAVRDLETAATLAMQTYGIDDAGVKHARLQELYKKWAEICDDLDNDPEAIVAEINKQIWSKVDFESYGM